MQKTIGLSVRADRHPPEGVGCALSGAAKTGRVRLPRDRSGEYQDPSTEAMEAEGTAVWVAWSACHGGGELVVSGSNNAMCFMTSAMEGRVQSCLVSRISTLR